MDPNVFIELTDAEVSNLITICRTSPMREGSEVWRDVLRELEVKLQSTRRKYT